MKTMPEVLLAVGLVGLAVMYLLEPPEPEHPARTRASGEWVLPDIPLGNAVVHRGSVACQLDICRQGHYGYWRLSDRRFECGCVKEGEAPPPEVFTRHSIVWPIVWPGVALTTDELSEMTREAWLGYTVDPPSPACGVSATCVGVPRLYCSGVK